MTLSDIEANSECKILAVGGENKRRLLDLGFTPGCKIKVKSVSPLGGTVLVCIRGVSVALRKNATNSIIIEAV